MNLRTQKIMAAKILKAGVSRVRVENDTEISEAITRNDIRGLIRDGMIGVVQKKGACTSPAKKKAIQKKKGRQMSKGSKKGTKNARKPSKEKWIEKIRPIRKMLKEMKEGNQIDGKDYRKLYNFSKGGTFRNKKHVLMYAKDHDMIKGAKARKAKIMPSQKIEKVKTQKPEKASGKSPSKKVNDNVKKN